MALSDSMFLFEITIEELKSLFSCKEHSILGQFADVFQIYLRNVNDLETSLAKQSKKKLAKKSRVRDIKTAKTSTMPKVLIKRSVLIAYDGKILKERMKQYPLELSFRSKYNSDVILASNQIPWSHAFIDYLNEIETKSSINPVIVENKYSVFHEYTSKRVATIKLSIKLSCLKDKLCTQFQYPYTSNFIQNTTLSTIKEIDLTHETGIIKTIYAGGKTKPKHSNSSQCLMETSNKQTDDKSKISQAKYIEFEKNNKDRNKLISLVKSHTDIEIKTKLTKPSLVTSQSCCSLGYTKHLSTLNYIFGNNSGPFGNRVYCVGFFTVQNESIKKLASPKVSIKDDKSSDRSSTDVNEKYHFNLCNEECPSKKVGIYGCPSHCSLDLPKDAAHLISVKHCDRIDCDAAKNREPPSPPDERLMVDLTSMKRDSCIISEKVEQVVGGMTAKMKMGTRPCYCSCECTFGFTKKTTFCNICGGVEKFGEEKLGPLAFPCPIYHKLVDKNKLKTVSSGSDSKKNKGSKHTNPSGDKNDESEKDNKKGKKKKKDDRFKFNYGYTGIRTYLTFFLILLFQ
ncbi:unnamed protein product [Chilo suppressalis]|uniref:Uncharacterized protein n=1 Tax=Chilo suppressalis TaxID=168631 RepID=A0ABN8L7L8_CHISP|nr:unnamed protein product [Chilo suppressalis]